MVPALLSVVLAPTFSEPVPVLLSVCPAGITQIKAVLQTVFLQRIARHPRRCIARTHRHDLQHQFSRESSPLWLEQRIASVRQAQQVWRKVRERAWQKTAKTAQAVDKKEGRQQRGQ